jgi:hypothetical protein
MSMISEQAPNNYELYLNRLNTKPHIYKQGNTWLAVRYRPYKQVLSARSIIYGRFPVMVMENRWNPTFGKDELSQITSSP